MIRIVGIGAGLFILSIAVGASLGLLKLRSQTHSTSIQKNDLQQESREESEALKQDGDVANPSLSPSAKLEGSVEILSVESDGTMQVYFHALGQGDVAQMRVWTLEEPNTWESFEPVRTMPFAEVIYVRYQDMAGNVSDVYSHSVHSPASPPLE